MLTILRTTGEVSNPSAVALPQAAVDATWIDLFDPTPEEEHAAEAWFGAVIPSRRERRRNEVSSHLYEEEGALVMTCSALASAEGERPRLGTITFVLRQDRLVSLRYEKLRAFDSYLADTGRKPHPRCGNGLLVLLGLMEALVERLAEILEKADQEVDRVSLGIFGPGDTRARARRSQSDALEAALKHVGRKRTIVTRARESLLTIERLLGFLEREDAVAERERVGRLAALQRDVRSLADHAGYVSGNIAYLTDAALGLVGLQQNKIIKIFTVVSVLFMPPTLVGTLYGMNFDHMPELHWPYGYLWAIGLMIASAAAPLWYFRRRRWF